MNEITFSQKRYTIPKNFINKNKAFYSCGVIIVDSLEIFQITQIWYNKRLKKELDICLKDPSPYYLLRIIDSINHLEAKIFGPRDSPYEGGTFF